MWMPEPGVKEEPEFPEKGRMPMPCRAIVTMTKETHDALRSYCYRHEIPIAVWIRQAIRSELKRCMAAEKDE